MKLRNKLVAVMAASMVVTSVPVITMADSTNTISVYNYNIKGTTIGFADRTLTNLPTTASDYSNKANYVKVGGGTTTDASLAVEIKAKQLFSNYTNTYTSMGNDFSIVNLPALEITPKSTYTLGGANAEQTQRTAFVSLTTDSNFVEDAYLYYMDAMATVDASSTSGLGTPSSTSNASTAMYIDDNGRIWNSNHGLYSASNLGGWDGRTRDEVTQQLKKVSEKNDGSSLTKSRSNVAPITLYFDANGNILVGTDRDNAVANGVNVAGSNAVAGVNLTIMDITEEEVNERKYKSTMRMDFFGTFEKDKTYKIPFLAKVGGDKPVLVNVKGGDSFVTSMTYTLTGNLTDKKLTATSGSKDITIDNSEEVGEIRLSETAVKALQNADNRWIKIALPSDSDLEFDINRTQENLKATGKSGFYTVAEGQADNTTNGATLKANASATDDFQVILGKEARSSRVNYNYNSSYYNNGYTNYTTYTYSNTTAGITNTITRANYEGNTINVNGVVYNYVGSNTATTGYDYYNNDTQILLIKLPAWYDETARGELELTGIYVRPQDKTAKTGEVNVTLSEDLTHGNTFLGTVQESKNLVADTTLKVANVIDYDVKIDVDKKAEVKAGRSGVVNGTKTTFVIKESVKDSLVDNRKIEISLDNGYIFGPADVYGANNNANGFYNTASYKQAAKQRFLELVSNKTIKFEEKAGDGDGKKGFELVDIIVDANGYVTGFTGYYNRLKPTDADKIKVTMPVATSVNNTGEVKVKVGNLFTRSYSKDIEAVVGEIKAPIEVTIDKAAIKVGLEEQTAGAITIKETNKGMFQKGWLFLSAENLQDGIQFAKVPTIAVSNEATGVKIENITLSKDKKAVAMEITRTSSEASEIKLTDLQFTVDRTVPEANYGLDIWGTAITDEDVLDVYDYSKSVLNASGYRGQYTDKYVVKEFIQMTTKNTQDISASGLKAATATFKMGEKKFTVNGESVDMDTAAYIKDGLTMVPVKYVAKAFGIDGNKVQYDKATSTATIVAGDKVIAITSGKAYLTVNGTQMPMATKAEVTKEGRMCVPMAYIASALDVQKTWDASSKTATFTNQSTQQN